MHPIRSVYDAMQHLVDRTDYDAGNCASRLLYLFNDLLYKNVIVFEGALTGIFGRNLLTEIIVTRGGDIENPIHSNGALNHLRNCRYDPIRIVASIGR